MSGPSTKVVAPRVAAIRALATERGRDPADILMFSLMTVILGETEAEAAAKFADYRRYISPEGALTLMSGWTGVDFSTYQLDQQVLHVQGARVDQAWTIQEGVSTGNVARKAIRCRPRPAAAAHPAVGFRYRGDFTVAECRTVRDAPEQDIFFCSLVTADLSRRE
jgi:alkanesulfonate monooxygenase SsuD/methylene tetrahydromethanopterin reductase-like flavin-dependent oxidoreductase (luciferase family)